MKNIEAAYPSVGVKCQDGIVREFRFSLLAMRLIQEHYVQAGNPDYKFFEQFDFEEHFADPSKMVVIVWAGMAYHEKQHGRLESWTIEKAEEVVGIFDLPSIIEAIQQAAIRSISEDQRRAIEARAKQAKDSTKKKKLSAPMKKAKKKKS